MMFRLVITVCCLCLGLAWAEEPPEVMKRWESVLAAEFQEGGTEAVMQAAAEWRAAQIAFGDECIFLYADVLRPEQEVIDNMRAAFARRVDEGMLQDLRAIVSYSPWCRRNDRGGFHLRTPEDAAWWLTDIPTAQPRSITCFFAGRSRMAPCGKSACDIHRDILKLCAQEISELYGGGQRFEPVAGTDLYREAVPVADIHKLRDAFEAAEHAWEAYCNAIVPQGDGAAPAAARYLLDRLYATHMQYLTFITDGVQSTLNISPQYGTFHISAGQQRHAFGEIFHDYAMFFRHPALPGNPWCMTMSGPSSPDAEFAYVIVPPCEELEAYAAAHPEGGLVFVHGYIDVEVTGKPYEPVSRPADASGAIPDPRPADAYSIRPVLRVISLMPLKW